MQKDPKAATPQLYHRTPQKVKVLEASAAQANAVHPVACTNTAADLADGRAQRVVKTRGDFAHSPASGKIFHDRHDDWAEVEDDRLAHPRCRSRSAPSMPLFGRRFQRNGGLALERHLRSQPEQRGDRIEEPAAGGGLDRLDLPREHGVHQCDLPFRRSRERSLDRLGICCPKASRK